MKLAYAFSGIAVLALLCAATASETVHAHWSYSGAGAPEHWADLSPDNAACAAGKRQSPVDIGAAANAPLPALKIAWAKGDYALVNNGHTIQLNAPPGGTLTIGGRRYDLLQFHFHAPSEHTLAGKAAPMEVHFVHREQGGSGLAVIGVFVDARGRNQTFAKIMAAAPHEEGGTATIALDPSALLPASRAYWAYEGSLTTPPCSEIVHWVVLKEKAKVNGADIAAFKSLYKMNARPVQKLNGREIQAAR